MSTSLVAGGGLRSLAVAVTGGSGTARGSLRAVEWAVENLLPQADRFILVHVIPAITSIPTPCGECIAADGFTYEYRAIKAWLSKHNVSPVTQRKLQHSMLTPNQTLRSAIQEWKSGVTLFD